jgi:hypothetical protein
MSKIPDMKTSQGIITNAINTIGFIKYVKAINKNQFRNKKCNCICSVFE